MARIISLIRYRFFLFAGIFPYLLGQVIAGSFRHYFDWKNFWLGFTGIFLALCGVEFFNEYFDAKGGGDRVFSPDVPHIPHKFYAFGIAVFAAAFCIGLYLALRAGWPVLLFSFLGFLAAYFYVGPPVKWAYRGFGESIIAFSYGPLMLLGSYYLQAQRKDNLPVFASFICALTIFSLAIVNEIPDYYQDKLVGKNNLVVRLGKNRAMVFLCWILCGVCLLLFFGIVFKKLPLLSAAVFLIIPGVFRNLAFARKNPDNPKVFLPVINSNIAMYLAVIFSLGIGYGMVF